MTAPVRPVSDDVPPDASATPAVAASVVPDRADAPVSEVTERFLRAIIAQVPADRIAELHLFSPLRQGTVETGIAVLATRVEVPAEVIADAAAGDADSPEFLLDHDVLDVDTEMHLEIDTDVDAAIDVTVDVDIDATVDAEVDAEVDADVDADVDTDVEAEVAVDVIADTEDAGDDEITIGERSHVVHAEAIIADDGSDDELLDDMVDHDLAVDELAHEELEVDAMIEARPARAVRHTVYTARYRYVIKGPERGKWEASVKAEAEAPLITVETVVRGVQRRAGEDTEIVRYSGAQIARALRLPTS